MSRKSSVITLGILAAIAAIGVTSCCCINWHDEEEQKDGVGHGRGGAHHGARRSHRWIPIFWGGGGGGGHPVGHGTGTGSGRGGFGSTGHGGGGGVGA